MDKMNQNESIEQTLRLIIDTKEPEAIVFIVTKIVNESIERKKNLMEKLDHEDALLDKMHCVLQELIKGLFTDRPF